jgi:hypothetical protein
MIKTVSRLSAIALAGVLATTIFSLYTFDAAAYSNGEHHNDRSRTTVDTENHAHVSNNVSVTAKTGGNEADGGDGEEGGNGGDAYQGFGGHGGNGGSGGTGGTITTGNAEAWGTLYNSVNTTDVTIDPCGCEEETQPHCFTSFFNFDRDNNPVRIDVDTNNSADVRNNLDVVAKTGGNEADGGDGEEGGNGGDVRRNQSWNNWFLWFNQQDTGGNGGTGGTGATGGTIRTGTAYANGLSDSDVNRTTVRIGKNLTETE